MRARSGAGSAALPPLLFWGWGLCGLVWGVCVFGGGFWWFVLFGGLCGFVGGYAHVNVLVGFGVVSAGR